MNNHNNSDGSGSDTVGAEDWAGGRWDWMTVGEQLFDRGRATREGHCYAAGRGELLSAVRALRWTALPAAGGLVLPAGPGEALRLLIAELRLPRVSAVAAGGALPVRDDHEGGSLYGLYGVRAHYRNADVTLYAVDRGTDVLPVVAHVQPPTRTAARPAGEADR